MDRDEARPFVSVKFDQVGRARPFLLSGVEFEPPLVPGDAVVVQRGEQRSYATVTRTVPQIAARKAPPAMSTDKVVRRATQQDVTTRLRHQHREREAQRVAVMKIRERSLPMKLVRVEQLFDSPRLVFYFTAEGRVDFRELVRELALAFRCRIEMRQVGARDEAKLVGGYGTCGRPLCCTTWLPGFAPVSIKMAKRQNLSLNPSRLSGLCGRLKCCLRYELPNAAGEQFAGCANEGSCSRSGGGCGGGCSSGGGCSGGGCQSCGSGA
ncbi:MAG: regulatory iron-sulfur-containing complex subunit RicT [Acidobacteria bacterium]|nr:regulatory iron-sulfur-containing complex subunit RicT [Acidobacteriota bacterium]